MHGTGIIIQETVSCINFSHAGKNARKAMQIFRRCSFFISTDITTSALYVPCLWSEDFCYPYKNQPWLYCSKSVVAMLFCNIDYHLYNQSSTKIL